MSMPQYTCIESTETNSISGTAPAAASATDDFPLAVVPTIATLMTDVS